MGSQTLTKIPASITLNPGNVHQLIKASQPRALNSPPPGSLQQLYAMEKCATLLRSVAMLPERAKLLVEVALEVLENAGGRPTDDKV